MIAWFAENMIWASAAMLLVLAIRRPVAAGFGAGIAYALWLIPLFRLVAPPADWIAGLFATPLPSLPPLLILTDGGADAPPPFAGPGQWAPILLAVWAGGVFLFLVAQAVRYRRFLAGLGPLREAGDYRGVPVVASEAAEGPLALGVARRRIVVPGAFEELYSGEERRLALEHERYHHRRGDILANHLALLVLALNWFNPVAWLAFRAFRADQEYSCDAAIAAAASAQERSDYARALVKSASSHRLVSACPLNGIDQLKRRLKMLNRHRRDPRRLLAGRALAATLATASLVVGVPGYAQDKAEPKQERRVIIMEHREEGNTAGGLRDREERRETIIRRHGDGAGHGARHRLDPEMEARVERCRNGSNALVNSNEGEGNQRTRILICAEGEGSAANQVEALERARERLAEDDNLSAEVKQRVLAQIDQALARARARN